jgi:hypothetical protein
MEFLNTLVITPYYLLTIKFAEPVLSSYDSISIRYYPAIVKFGWTFHNPGSGFMNYFIRKC